MPITSLVIFVILFYSFVFFLFASIQESVLYGLNGVAIFILNENFKKETLFVVNQNRKGKNTRIKPFLFEQQ